MTDNIKLPPMPKPQTPPVFATAANTQSVKAGYELGGYEKTPPLFDEHQLEAYAREAVRLNAQAQQPLTDEKDALLRQALEALEGFANITNDSQGVKGYHLNGDIAEWDEFDEVDAASSTIEAIRTYLGVKND